VLLSSCELITPAAVPKGAAVRCLRNAFENPDGIECCGAWVLPLTGLDAILSHRFPATAPLHPIAWSRRALGDERTRVTVHVLTGMAPCVTGKPRFYQYLSRSRRSLRSYHSAHR